MRWLRVQKGRHVSVLDLINPVNIAPGLFIIIQALLVGLACRIRKFLLEIMVTEQVKSCFSTELFF